MPYGYENLAEVPTELSSQPALLPATMVVVDVAKTSFLITLFGPSHNRAKDPSDDTALIPLIGAVRVVTAPVPRFTYLANPAPAF